MSAEPICGADIVIKALVDQGVEIVFGYPGGAVLPIYDSLFKQNALRHILVRQEGGAVHAAEGYARSTGKVGVVLVTSGPGATNAVTGLTDALMDSIPIVCLTGQVPTHLIGNDAFQEADTTGITRPCTKHNYLVKDVADLARILHEAFYVAKSGRPGPVVVDLPKDVLFALGALHPARAGEAQDATGRRRTPDPARVAEALELIAAAKKPLFYGGGGLINSGPEACARFTEFVRLVDAPCTLTLMGLGALPASDPHFLGMVGMHGTLRGEHGDARLRRDDRGRLALRRPGDRTAQRLLAELEENPHRHRPVLDQQERARRRAAARRLRRDAERRCSPGGARLAPRTDGAARNAWWRQIDAWRARDCLRYDRSRNGHHQAAIRAGAALRADIRTATCTSRPRSASTRCGRRSSSSSSSPTAG